MPAHAPPAEAASSSASAASFSTVALLDVGLVRHFLELGDDGSLTRDTVVDVSSDGQRVGCARKSRLLVLQPLADISLPPTQLSLKNDEVRCLEGSDAHPACAKAWGRWEPRIIAHDREGRSRLTDRGAKAAGHVGGAKWGPPQTTQHFEW